MTNSNRLYRTAFTLVEMLVVLFILLTLTALIVSVAFRPLKNRALSQGAEQLQGYLLMARSRAKKDNLPTGVRLQADSSKVVRIVQMVQQPDIFNGGTVHVDPSNLRVVYGTSIDFHGGFSRGESELWPVQRGDYLEVKGGGLVHRVSKVLSDQLILESGLPWQLNSTIDYRVVRKPRILLGETPLQLPEGIVVDLATNDSFKGPLPPANSDGSVDLIFLPGGALADTAGGFCPLWVRNTSEDGQPFGGEPRLIVIYPRTGFIASHPIDLGDPYLYANDGRSSGF